MKKYSIADFIYWFEKYTDINTESYTQVQIAQIIGKAMVDFFEESNTAY